MKSSVGDADILLSNVSCRILVLSTATSQAKSCIHRVMNLGNPELSSPPSNIPDKAMSMPDHSGSSSLVKIPWTITNKYYSALVHFATRTIHGLSPHEVQNVPAIIFVWSQGESYKHHIERILQDLSGSETEVCLAVRIAQQMPTSLESFEEEEEEGEIDTFLSSRGFEYINAMDNQLTSSNEELGVGSSWSTEFPGLERVLDALSTVMWPSMVPKTKDTSSSLQTHERERAFLDWAHTSRDNTLSAAEGVAANSSSQLSARTRSMKLEMQELARWLEDDTMVRDDPWRSAASTGEMTGSPTAINFGKETLQAEQIKIATLGFDDDFTVFVSAPPAVGSTQSSGRSTPDLDLDGLSPTSAHPHAGSLYHSLGSVSDFGGSDDGRDLDNENIGDDLPTKEEIMATSSRIFGLTKLPLPPAIISRMDTEKPPKGVATSPDQVSSKILSEPELEAFVTTESQASDVDNGGSYDMEPFDLSRVLGALQEMKAEIASMENEDERRKAAARAALGLVYGLEADAASV